MILTPDVILPYLEKLRLRHSELQTLLSDTAVYSDARKCRELNCELRHIDALFQTHEQWMSVIKSIDENTALLATETDADMLEMIHADLADLATRKEDLSNALIRLLLPPDPHDGARVMVEIHPAAGGDEAALFSGELLRAYTHYAELQHWKMEVLSLTGSDLGGVKDVVFSLAGQTVYERMKFESGVHRVQRVPVTESAGRVHTSTITVAVLPEAEEVDFELKPEDLRFDVFRSSGPGGQCVNTTDSAVRVTHIPTGMSVASQQEKSQHRNKEIAIRILRSRLLEQKQREEAEKRADSKRVQVGTGDRSERIRTYNFPQSRCTDHRYELSFYNLPALMEGDLTALHDQILTSHAQMRLQALDSE